MLAGAPKGEQVTHESQVEERLRRTLLGGGAEVDASHELANGCKRQWISFLSPYVVPRGSSRFPIWRTLADILTGAQALEAALPLG